MGSSHKVAHEQGLFVNVTTGTEGLAKFNHHSKTTVLLPKDYAKAKIGC